jgi:glycerol uptake facilitator-like aquaporin/catechol 2,3-dioxygenase-like lactoylglutathione lyase family enzyme
MFPTIRRHWPEYLSEAAGLGLFMLSACSFAVVLSHPASPLATGVPSELIRRAAMGIAMGLTCMAIVYSPAGQRSGAHLNPVMTLTFLRLGKVAPVDAAAYIVMQFAGGLCGALLSGALWGRFVTAPPVQFAATVPGPAGVVVAFVVEVVISFVLMGVVLISSNQARLARWTGVFAGTLVAINILLTAHISGMSMNPARSLASAWPANVWTSLWIYFAAPPLGMLAAAECCVRMRGAALVSCAKLHHTDGVPCIFCEHQRRKSQVPVSLDVEERTRHPGRVLSRMGLVTAILVLTTHTSLADPPVDTVIRVGITVSDLDRAVEFYTHVLDFEPQGEVELTGEEYERLQGVFGLRMRVATLQLGDEEISLTEFLAPTGRPVPDDSRSNDCWFQHIAIVVSDMERAYARLRQFEVRHASAGPQRLPDWNPNAAGIEAFYFKDPDGHVLEIIHFPPDKGDPRWQKPGDRLFLGIDHTAIVVRETESSLRFYRDLLGLRVAGSSENYGVEQERLNNVFGARLRITTLRARHGPGVELLEYLAPSDGREYPHESRANDLLHWHTDFASQRFDELSSGLRTARVSHVSPDVVILTDGTGNSSRALHVRDPDRHAVRLIQR